MDNKLIPISAIGEVAQEEPIYVTFGEATVALRRRVSYVEILDMVQFVINFAVTDQPILDGALSRMLKDFAIVKFYTNLDVSIGSEGATVEAIYNEYDVLMTYGVIADIKCKISEQQLRFFNETVDETLANVMRFRNSARGVLDSIAENADKDSNTIQGAIDMLSGENADKITDIINAARTISGDKTAPEPVEKINPEEYGPAQ